MATIPNNNLNQWSLNDLARLNDPAPSRWSFDRDHWLDPDAWRKHATNYEIAVLNEAELIKQRLEKVMEAARPCRQQFVSIDRRYGSSTFTSTKTTDWKY